jgi:GTPase SAR1 family protein
MSQIRAHADQGVCTILIGNKSDLSAQRVSVHCLDIITCIVSFDVCLTLSLLYRLQAISYEEGAAVAKEFGIPFIETSAVNGVNVEEAFTKLIEDVYDSLEDAGAAGARNGVIQSGKGPSSGTRNPAGTNTLKLTSTADGNGSSCSC